MEQQDRLLGSFIGLAIGDAVGTTVEFRERDTFEPVTDMVGKGPFNLPAGYFTDDTSMALCLAESLIAFPDFSRIDLLERFSRWYRDGENSPTGRCFDIGSTTRSAIVNWEKTGSTVNNTGPWDAGNGSIMRLSPVAIKYHNDADRAIAVAVMQSETTHGSTEACDSCDLLTRILLTAYATNDKNAVLNIDPRNEWADSVKNILKTLDVTRDEVKSSGYVIHTLHAALWCFKNTDNFRDAILLATNLGDDADTVAAVTGQIAGAFYGLSGIPLNWIAKIYEFDRFVELTGKLVSE